MYHETDESYVPLSRGIRRYLKTYSLGAQSLYIWILSGADWRPGSDYGALDTTTKEACLGIGVSGNSLRKYLHELSNGWPLSSLSRSGKTAPPFISYEISGTGRGQRLRIKIRKAKMTASAFKKNGKPKAPPAKTTRAPLSPGRVPPPDITDIDDLEAEIDDHVQKLIDELAGKMDVGKEKP